MRMPQILGAAPLTLGLVAVLGGPVAAQTSFETLRAELEARIAAHEGHVAVTLLDPNTGESLSIRGDEPFPAASLVKVPVLVQLFHQVERGAIRLEDPLLLIETDKQPGSGLLRHLSAPHRLTVLDAPPS